GLPRAPRSAGTVPRTVAPGDEGLIAASAGAPNRSRRPPNATAQMPNQDQPITSPATTSENQWTPSNTRVQPTATAIDTAAPPSAARTLGGPPTPTTRPPARQVAA